jgi:chromosome segregation ATPase
MTPDTQAFLQEINRLKDELKSAYSDLEQSNQELDQLQRDYDGLKALISNFYSDFEKNF